MASKNDILARKPLGQILLEKNVISQQELDLALERQTKETEKKYIGQIFLEMGVPQYEINKALDSYHHRKKVGEILLESNLITETQLEEALQRQKEQKMPRKPLGKILIELGYITQEDLMQALSKHFVMKIVSLEDYNPSKNLQRVVGEKYALDKRIVVLQFENGTIKLALSDPNLFFMEEMQKFLPLGKRMEFFLASPREIDPCLKRLYAPLAAAA